MPVLPKSRAILNEIAKAIVGMQMAVAGETFADVQKDWIKPRMTFPILPKPRLQIICLPGLWLISNVSSECDIDAASTTFIAQRVSALLVVGAGGTLRDSRDLPIFASFVIVGGQMKYGPSLADLFCQTATTSGKLSRRQAV